MCVGGGGVVGLISGCDIPKTMKMVPVDTLLRTQHYEASTGFSSPQIRA